MVFISKESNIEILVGVAPPPSLIPTLWNIGILQYKQAKLRKHLQHSVHKIQSVGTPMTMQCIDLVH